ncbi:DNA sulfur modification protein DndB [Archangium lansingense]|uniref:Uncharacterized protein n=1 Tax=Archangium lansingense TaxID=2995310 RepID=A0ABT3ZX41_9BACT|nr:DNA sulfur modification protein DndB [Archangium lansinium]MCY1073964.1 hypothetical protein [Archangium lansinium]
MRQTVFVEKSVGKTVLVGTFSAAEVVSMLLSGHLGVNPEAQRSLSKGASKETTKELLQDERVHRTPRMERFVDFLRTVIRYLDQGYSSHGFLGAIQLVIPEEFQGAQVRFIEADTGNLPGGLSIALASLGKHTRIATLEMNPSLDEIAMAVGDGQGRCFGLYSLRKTAQDMLTKARREQKKISPGSPEAETLRVKIEECEGYLNKVSEFLSNTAIPFVIYAKEIKANGSIVGLDLTAQKRLYIEGNALNSQASKEEQVKFESFSPVTLSLQEDRIEDENRWMSSDFIEEDSKSVSKSSIKLFTLSALVQAYSLSMLGRNDGIKDISEEAFQDVSYQKEFVKAFWKRVSNVLNDLWIPEVKSSGDRLKYLNERREEQNVAFQAVFLQALGKVGYTLGEKALWAPESPLLSVVDQLKNIELRAKVGDPSTCSNPNGQVNKHEGCCYTAGWVQSMMVAKHDGGEFAGYTFNNTRDTIERTYQHLLTLFGLSGAPSKDSAAA